MDSDNSNKTIIFNLVWNNIYIRKIIIDYLELYNISNDYITFYSLEEWNSFKYKSLLYKVIFNFRINTLDSIPSNIKYIQIQPLIDKNDTIKSIPESIVSIGLLFLEPSFLCSPFYNSVKSKLTSIELFSNDPNIPIIITEPPTTSTTSTTSTTLLPESITNVQIKGRLLNNELCKGTLPNNVKYLYCQSLNSIEDGSISQSIKEAKFVDSKPIIINQLPTLNLTKLVFNSLNLVEIDHSIKFPNCLQYLEVSCLSFNSTLPETLKSFKLGVRNLLYSINFPSSLLNIQLIAMKNTKYKSINELFGACKLDNLESLSLDISNVELGDEKGVSGLPNSLKHLTLKSFYWDLKPNLLPSSLLSLTLGSLFKHSIGINVLPSSLTSLTFSYGYDEPINYLSIPPNLKLLELKSDYSHPIDLKNNPYTIISCDDLFNYYKPSMEYPDQLKVFKLPDFGFIHSLSKLSLHNKSSLEYLHLGYTFNKEINLLDLPIENNIKTLVLGNRYNQIIHLNYFKKLENIILKPESIIKISTTTTNNIYNYYSLKNIIISSSNSLKYLDIEFYRFIKYNK